MLIRSYCIFIVLLLDRLDFEKIKKVPVVNNNKNAKLLQHQFLDRNKIVRKEQIELEKKSNKYARLVANDLANNIDLNNAQGWEVELVLNSKKNGYDHEMANQHSFVVLKYNGVRTWVLDPWGNNLPEIYDYNEFSKVWPLTHATVSTVTNGNDISDGFN
jgi:hypothetical protein